LSAARRRWFRASAGGLGALLFFAASGARAQSDINPPLTNALLLVDTSGSMEYKADGTEVTCNPASALAVNDKSRWTNVIEVLTGTIDNYTCQTIDRTNANVGGFKTGEYAINGQAPYDFRYPIPYHRPVSNGCVAGPGVESSNPFIYPAGAISYHNYNSLTACTTWSQRGNDGILDSFRNDVRFALMTFDTLPNAGTGYTGTMATAVENTTTGMAGLWSYSPISVAKGAPAGCATTTDQEVGARNGAAPPWEGRLVNFGNPYDGVRAYDAKNNHIQEVLLASRPYGATPIAGMLQDAEDFLLNDTSKDPDRNPSTLSDSDLASDFGPYRDPYLKCTIPRKEIVILLTDGEPNMDLRPYCAITGESPAGVCPFRLPEEIATELNTDAAAHKAIKTYVVGFALDKVDHDNNPATAPLDCNTLTTTDVSTVATSLCGNPANATNTALQACCTLQRIAIAGGTKAYFSSDSKKLRTDLASILSQSLNATSRTQPVAAPLTNSSGGGGAQYLSGFVPVGAGTWYGSLQRHRIICDDPSHPGTPWPQDITQSKGDDFAHNLAVGGPDARRVYTMIAGSTLSDPIQSANTIRPNVGTVDPDGLGTYGGRYYSGLSRAFIDSLPNEAVAIPTAACIDENGQALTPDACRKQYFNWWLGYNNGQTTVISRCVGAPDCRLLGDIVHSTPVVVDKPSAAIRDESYQRFANAQATRPQVMYVSSNDGLLHAFKTASNDPADKSDDTKKVLNDGASNELWAFVPPATLPNVANLYPHTHQVLLDGIAAVQDVVAVTPSQADVPPTVFERAAADAQKGTSSWRTVLVQGFGSGHSGYFAVDVTNPVPDASAPDNVNKGGPRMLWQITNDGVGKNLFGRGGATPAIATLYFDPDGGTSPREIPVAVLPGGAGGTQITSGTGCPDGGRAFSDVSIDSNFPPRQKVHCYDFPGGAEKGAVSLSIVRLDTGELIRTFRPDKTDVSDAVQPRVTETELDSPITGQPVAFPALVGQVADRVFVGDQDGRMWRVNVSSTDPSKWTMKLFFDLYPRSFGAGAGMSFSQGQPIMVPPLVSVDENNNMVLNVATGDQEGLGYAQGQKTLIYSLSEQTNTSLGTIGSKVNWYKQFADGDRVVGPMVLFNRGLYFGTFSPAPTGSVCDSGTSNIWGMDYLTPTSADDLSQGGKRMLTDADLSASGLSAAPSGSPQLIQSVSSSVAFGPSVMQQPSCYTQSDLGLGDGVLGFGHQVGLGQVATGNFQLVFQTGNNKSGSAVPTANIGVHAINLPAPPTLSSIESWASIVE